MNIDRRFRRAAKNSIIIQLITNKKHAIYLDSNTLFCHRYMPYFLVHLEILSHLLIGYSFFTARQRLSLYIHVKSNISRRQCFHYEHSFIRNQIIRLSDQIIAEIFDLSCPIKWLLASMSNIRKPLKRIASPITLNAYNKAHSIKTIPMILDLLSKN